MNGDELPGEDNVVRYAPPTKVIDGEVDGKAFRLGNGSGISVNWLDYFESQPKTQQLEDVRRVIQMQLKPRGVFAELNVGITQELASLSRIALRFIHRPNGPEKGRLADPSHAEIEADFMTERPNDSLLGDVIAVTIQAHHPAVAPPS